MSDYNEGQLDFLDTLDYEPRSGLEKENEDLKNLLMGYISSDDSSAATEKFLMLVVRKMSRYLSDSNRKRIILSSFYTLHNDVDESTFENVLNEHIHEFDLKCNDWDEYYAERKGARRKRC